MTLGAARLPVVIGLTISAACSGVVTRAAPARTTLKGAFAPSFLVGAAVNRRQIDGADSVGDALIARHFNSISPENVLKWVNVGPQPGQFNFELADRYVGLGERYGAVVIGHTLVWHNQTPAWVFADANGAPVSR